MLTNITWGNYLLIISLLSTAWYLFVGFRYFRHDFQILFSGDKTAHEDYFALEEEDQEYANNLVYKPEPAEHNEDEEIEDDFAQQVDEFILRVKEDVSEAITKRHEKEDVALILALTMQTYPEVKDSDFRPVMDELILSECEKQGIHFFNEKEITALWNKKI